MRTIDRFLKYVTIHTTSDEKSGAHPSFDGEFILANRLKDELIELGLLDVVVDEKCYVYATLPATEGYENCAHIGFIAHMDTAPDASGLNVQPVLHENYDGGDVYYPKADTTMKVDDFPELKGFIGETLVTSDGTTLLGSDDKAGIAEIMSSLEEIVSSKIAHGPIEIAFTPDEEIGEGADNFDLKRFTAEYAYTVDGGDIDCIEYENFNAASAVVDVKGFSVHPGEAKNKMINASLVAMEFNDLLPKTDRPENTEGYEGFFHLHNMSGSCEKATLAYLIRDFNKDSFENRKLQMKNAAATINSKYGEGTVILDINDSYYNMVEKIIPHMHLVENAKKAISSVGIIPRTVPIRGGTDGARLSYEGLPCPNLGTGGYNFHGPFEYNSVERMDKMVQIIVELVKIYSKT